MLVVDRSSIFGFLISDSSSAALHKTTSKLLSNHKIRDFTFTRHNCELYNFFHQLKKTFRYDKTRQTHSLSFNTKKVVFILTANSSFDVFFSLFMWLTKQRQGETRTACTSVRNEYRNSTERSAELSAERVKRRRRKKWPSRQWRHRLVGGLKEKQINGCLTFARADFSSFWGDRERESAGGPDWLLFLLRSIFHAGGNLSLIFLQFNVQKQL